MNINIVLSLFDVIFVDYSKNMRDIRNIKVLNIITIIINKLNIHWIIYIFEYSVKIFPM